MLTYKINSTCIHHDSFIAKAPGQRAMLRHETHNDFIIGLSGVKRQCLKNPYNSLYYSLLQTSNWMLFSAGSNIVSSINHMKNEILG